VFPGGYEASVLYPVARSKEILTGLLASKKSRHLNLPAGCITNKGSFQEEAIKDQTICRLFEFIQGDGGAKINLLETIPVRVLNAQMVVQTQVPRKITEGKLAG
jgi:hypothetical protein